MAELAEDVAEGYEVGLVAVVVCAWLVLDSCALFAQGAGQNIPGYS